MSLWGTSLGMSFVLDRFADLLRSGRIRSATAASCARAPPFPRFERCGLRLSPEESQETEGLGHSLVILNLTYLPLRAWRIDRHLLPLDRWHAW